jgi:ribulose-phosphate 3-epimerase
MMASVIAPAVLAENADQYKQAMERIQPFAQRVHLDFCDGEFAPSFTVASNELWWPAEWQADIHAMVARPSEHVDALIALKAGLIIFHAEVQEDLLPILQRIKQAGIKAGIALQRSTVPESVRAYIEQADHVMIFSGDLGHYGGTASMMQLEKVRLIKAIRPTVEIGWDGGVSLDNAFSLSQGGIDVLNVGGAIAKSSDPSETYQKLVAEIGKHGVL